MANNNYEKLYFRITYGVYERKFSNYYVFEQQNCLIWKWVSESLAVAVASTLIGRNKSPLVLASSSSGVPGTCFAETIR